jgi:hypothetical protein
MYRCAGERSSVRAEQYANAYTAASILLCSGPGAAAGLSGALNLKTASAGVCDQTASKQKQLPGEHMQLDAPAAASAAATACYLCTHQEVVIEEVTVDDGLYHTTHPHCTRHIQQHMCSEQHLCQARCSAADLASSSAIQ